MQPAPTGHKGAGPSKPLDQRYRARVGCLFRTTGLLEQMRGDDAIDYPGHLARDHRTTGEAKTYGPHPNWNGKLSTLGNCSDTSDRYIALLHAIHGVNWRTGLWGNTSSTRRAALSAMRRVPQLGQTKSGADKIAGSDFEPPQAGPKGEGAGCPE